MGFAILFWLFSLLGVVFLPSDILSKHQVVFGILHTLISTMSMFFFTQLFFKKIDGHCIEFTLITFLTLLEYHFFSRFQAFEAPKGGMNPFVIVFFFMAIITIPTFFAVSYIFHKCVFFVVRFLFARREVVDSN
jgi:hypothetical protein